MGKFLGGFKQNILGSEFSSLFQWFYAHKKVWLPFILICMATRSTRDSSRRINTIYICVGQGVVWLSWNRFGLHYAHKIDTIYVHDARGR